MSGVAIIVVPPGEGEVVPRRYGERTVVKAAEAETGGAYAVRENSAPAGGARRRRSDRPCRRSELPALAYRWDLADLPSPTG